MGGLIENITISSSNLVGVEVEAELGNTSFLIKKKNSDKTYLNLILHLIVHLNVHMVHLVHILVYLVPYFQFSVSPKRSLLYFIGWCSSHISVCSSHIYDGLIENITISSSNLVGVKVEAELGNTSFLIKKKKL